MDLAQERLESAKAGLVGAIAAAIGFVVLLNLYKIGFNLLQSNEPWHISIWTSFAGQPNAVIVPSYEPLEIGIRTLIVAFTGLLFGVTYRYAIRTDNNPQLKTGAIAAFGLVRGSAQLDQALTDHMLVNLHQIGNLALGILESVIMLAIAGWAIDWAIRRHWISPFSATFSVNGHTE